MKNETLYLTNRTGSRMTFLEVDGTERYMIAGRRIETITSQFHSVAQMTLLTDEKFELRIGDDYMDFKGNRYIDIVADKVFG